ncbi:Uncharacterised protein [Amycolatopsis camponoti]|uniref:Uncharacterized protein n=1 Tax=Amycolatopsis camponoti TaxID=2606593 RepID=A0A6I8LWL6_9PSEU|nr:Uncharacterised protein [Amycolatopsis camponoti]
MATAAHWGDHRGHSIRPVGGADDSPSSPTATPRFARPDGLLSPLAA